VVGSEDIRGIYDRLSPVEATSALPADLPAFPPCPVDRYRFVGELARGGMGVLVRAVDTLLGRDVVVKLLREEFVGRRSAERRFLREAQVNSRLQHPGIVPVYDAGRFPNGRPFLTLKYVPGRTLESLLLARTNAAVARPELLRIVAEVSSSLAYAHAQGVIHRDLKPGNVMISLTGEVCVLDWGLATILSCPRPPVDWLADPNMTPLEIEPAGLTQLGLKESTTGVVIGTPAYMPPEQAGRGHAGLDERCDVFGLGGLLTVVLTGLPPYVAASASGVWAMARQGDLAEAYTRVRASEADPALIDLTLRCLAADPSARPRTAQEVARALARLVLPSGSGLARWV
jgi:serine/threonine protein kinase